jgi:hypothetical protein
MKKRSLFASTTAIALAMAIVVPVKADLGPPPPPLKPQAQQQAAVSNSSSSGGLNSPGFAAAKAIACPLGSGMVQAGKPVPLKHMSKRQWVRYEIEVKRWKRAHFEWAGGCAVIGPVGGAAPLAVDDFASRFITHEIPIARTPRQEQLLFARDGSAPYPDLSKPDPDQYGPR